MDRNNEKIAGRFLTGAICEFGQPKAQRIEATQEFITAAGFDAKATSFPIFGQLLPMDFEGKDGAAAFQWLRQTLIDLKRGKCEEEIAQLQGALDKRQAIINQ